MSNASRPMAQGITRIAWIVKKNAAEMLNHYRWRGNTFLGNPLSGANGEVLALKPVLIPIL